MRQAHYAASFLPRAWDKGSATAASWMTSNPLGGKPKRLFCFQSATPDKSKASCLKLATDFYLLICSLEQEYKKICQILVTAVAPEISGKTSAEEGNKPTAHSQYQLFSLPIKLGAHTNRQQQKFEKGEKRRLAGRDDVRKMSLSRGGIQNLSQRTFRGREEFDCRVHATVGDVTCIGISGIDKSRKKVHLISSFALVNPVKI